MLKSDLSNGTEINE